MASCQFPAECKNTEKSYYCYCPNGTTKVSTKPLTCNDENECEKNVCGKNFKCRNTIGSYKCQCGEGFQNDSPDSCTDIDECADPVTFLTLSHISISRFILQFKVKGKVCYEPSGPSGRRLSLVTLHEATRSISTPPWMGC